MHLTTRHHVPKQERYGTVPTHFVRRCLIDLYFVPGVKTIDTCAAHPRYVCFPNTPGCHSVVSNSVGGGLAQRCVGCDSPGGLRPCIGAPRVQAGWCDNIVVLCCGFIGRWPARSFGCRVRMQQRPCQTACAGNVGRLLQSRIVNIRLTV